MRRTSGTVNVKTAIALVLVVISLAMVLLPWMEISIEIMGKKQNLSDLIDRACTMEGVTRAEFNFEMQASLAEAMEDLQGDTGLVLDAKAAVKNLNKILDGGISLLDLATISTYMGGVLADVDEMLSLGFSRLTASDRMLLTMISDAKLAMFIATVVFWVMTAAIVATFVFAVLSLLRENKVGPIVFAAAVALVAVGFGIATFAANDSIQNYASFVVDELEDLLWSVGAGTSGLLSFEFFHLTAAPFVCVLCAVGAAVLTSMSGVKNIDIDLEKLSKLENLGKWTCPRCGAANKIGNAFCMTCGTKRPEKPRCPSCNSEIQEGARFCVKCGQDLSGMPKPEYERPVRYEAPVTPVAAPRREPAAGGGLRGSMAKPDDSDL